jgi:uncharacterized protein
MIRSEHAIMRFDFQKQIVIPDRLHRQRHAHYSPAITQCVSHYRSSIGETRQDLHLQVEQILVQLGDCSPRRVAAFCKLLDDLGQFDSGRDAAKLRKKVFSMAAPWHPVVETREGIFEQDVNSAYRRIEQALGQPWKEIAANLFSDVIELQQLKSFDESVVAEQILSQYNLAQTQAALYHASRVRINAQADWKPILQSAKLAGLMHTITKLHSGASGGYLFLLDGPGSQLRETTRYGIKFAQIIPTLLSCKDWSLRAEVIGPKSRKFRLNLSPQDGLRSTVEPSMPFDSSIEVDVDRLWRKAPTPGWTLSRQSELLFIGQTVYTPDFQLKSDDGKEIFIEVVGYWTPEYLQEKARRIEIFRDLGPHRFWLLMFTEKPTAAKYDLLTSLNLPTIVFQRKQDPVDWIRAAIGGSANGFDPR